MDSLDIIVIIFVFGFLVNLPIAAAIDKLIIKIKNKRGKRK